jgi:deoxyribonuclease V
VSAQPNAAVTGAGRYAAVDVHYPPDGGANAALVIAAEATFITVIAEHVVCVPETAPYRAGAFALRELPAIRAVLADVGRLDLLVVDGYVHLDPHGRPGLGAHAHDVFAIPVIGVAKNPFPGARHAIQVRRGSGHRPLYITAAGLPAEQAAALVRQMAGPYRIPDALRRVDTLARSTGHRAATASKTPGPGHMPPLP